TRPPQCPRVGRGAGSYGRPKVAGRGNRRSRSTRAIGPAGRRRQGLMAAILPEQWMREVRRLCSALGAASTESWGGPVSLLQTGAMQGGNARLIWRATCPVATTDADTADGAMSGLVEELTQQLDKRIK